jgi:hypothetical protein
MIEDNTTIGQRTKVLVACVIGSLALAAGTANTP